MSILITDEGVTFKDGGGILREVKRFYGKLCLSAGSTPETLAAREELLSFVSSHITNK